MLKPLGYMVQVERGRKTLTCISIFADMPDYAAAYSREAFGTNMRFFLWHVWDRALGFEEGIRSHGEWRFPMETILRVPWPEVLRDSSATTSKTVTKGEKYVISF